MGIITSVSYALRNKQKQAIALLPILSETKECLFAQSKLRSDDNIITLYALSKMMYVIGLSKFLVETCERRKITRF